MRTYLTPEIVMIRLDDYDVITASFGKLEQLPSGDETPPKDLVESEFDW